VICYLDDVLREGIMSPCRRRMLNHRNDGLIPLIVSLMKLNCFSPHLMELTSSNELWNMKSLRVSSDVIHQSMRLIFSIHDTEIGVNTVVSSFVAHSLF
jgi:hypothetical protein